jgi:hypothetical protein
VAVTKPEFITEAETAWDTTTPKETPSITVQAGDVLIAFADCEEVSGGTANLSTPSGGGLTWSLVQRVLVNSYNETAIWSATATEAKTFKVTFARGATSRRFGGNVLVFRKSGGVGASAKTNVSSGAPTLDITTAKEHSAIVVASGDWNATNGSSRTWRTNAGALTEQTYQFINGVWTVYGGLHADAGAAAKYAVGLSAPSGQKYSIVAVEVYGQESGGEESKSGTSSISATATATATGSKQAAGTSAVSASSSASAQGSAARSGSSQVSASASASAQGSKSASASSSVSATSSCSASGSRGAGASSSVSASSSASASGSKGGLGSSSISASGVLSAQGSKATSSASAIVSAVDASASGSRQAFGTSSITATVVVTAVGGGSESKPEYPLLPTPTTAVFGEWVTFARVGAPETSAVVYAASLTAQIAPVASGAVVASPGATAAEIATQPSFVAELEPFKTEAKVRA